jgi:hypothetical protein
VVLVKSTSGNLSPFGLDSSSNKDPAFSDVELVPILIYALAEKPAISIRATKIFFILFHF